MISCSCLSGFFNSLSPTLVKVLRATAAIVLLLLVALFIDVGDALLQLQQTQWHWLVPALLLLQIQMVLSAIRWKITANRLGQHLSLKRAVSEYYLATFANLSLPGGVTGDAARVYRNRQTPALSVAVHGVMLERLAGQLALLVVSIVGWLLWPILMNGAIPEAGTRVVVSAIALVIVIALCFRVIIRLAPERITRAVLAVGPAVHAAWWSDRQWIVQSVLSLSIVSTYMLVFVFSSYAVQAPLPFAAAITIVPLVLLSMVVPLSIGGWGIREASAAVLWPLAGLSSEAGIATSVVYALVSLIGCVPGLLMILVFRRRPSRAA